LPEAEEGREEDGERVDNGYNVIVKYKQEILMFCYIVR
jgi:hypothetical protein